MGRPPSGLDEYLDWQQRLESQKASGLSVPVFCLQEGVSDIRIFLCMTPTKMSNFLPNDLRECQHLLLAAFKQATQLERRMAESEQQVAELNRVLGETAASYQELQQEHTATLDERAWYKRWA